MERKLISPASAGFTLIELLVVIAVIAVLALGAVLAVGRGQGAQAAPDMALFADRFALAQGLAVEGRRTAGLNVREGHTQLLWLQGGAWVAGARPVAWRGRVAFTPRHRLAGQGRPDILLLSNGQSTAFEITFAQGRCENDGWTGLQCSGD